MISEHLKNDDTLSVRSIINDHPSEFLKDLAKDLELREWKRLGHDFEVVLDDCPVNVNLNTSGPYFCAGYIHYFIEF